MSPRSEAGARAARTISVPWLPRRARAAHKGDFGRVLVVAGSARMPGAAFLCGEAAMRSGAGLTTIAVPEPLLAVLGAKVVVETLAPLPSDAGGTLAAAGAARAAELAAGFDAVALGPGITTDGGAPEFARAVAAAVERPLVLDADGLNAHAGALERLASRRSPTVLTPHPGEAARLLSSSIESIQSDRIGAAKEIARRARAVVVLKGAGSVVTDGDRVHVNRTGNPGMATGGSGDVLTGAIAALLARGLGPLDAAVLGAHVHGRAGDLAARERGEEGLLATDLLAPLAAALRERTRGRRW